MCPSAYACTTNAPTLLFYCVCIVRLLETEGRAVVVGSKGGLHDGREQHEGASPDLFGSAERRTAYILV